MAGLRQPGADRAHVEERELRLPCDLLRGVARNDAQLGLRLRKRGFHVEPRLIARRFGKQCPNAGIRHAVRGRLVEHRPRPLYVEARPRRRARPASTPVWRPPSTTTCPFTTT